MRLERAEACPLRCIERATTTTDAIGWRALLAVGDEDAEGAEEVAFYCPLCAAREFDGP